MDYENNRAHGREHGSKISAMDLLRQQDPNADSSQLSDTLQRIKAICKARPDTFSELAASLSAEFTLFEQPSLSFRNNVQKDRVMELWDEAKRAVPVEHHDIKKLSSLEEMVRSGWKISLAEKQMMETAAIQIREHGVGKGYLLDSEKSLLNEASKYREDFDARLPKGPSFEELGLVWKWNNERWEPAHHNTRFRNSTFATLPPRYFQECRKRLKSGAASPESQILDDIYKRCIDLQKKGSSNGKNWDAFLSELQTRYPTPDSRSEDPGSQVSPPF